MNIFRDELCIAPKKPKAPLLAPLVFDAVDESSVPHLLLRSAGGGQNCVLIAVIQQEFGRDSVEVVATGSWRMLMSR